MTLFQAATLELLKSILALVILYITWAVGQRFITHWELKRKARELDLSIATQFQQLFGEFKEIWRLWKALKSSPPLQGFVFPEDARWQLLVRASAAEGRVEAIFVKLATDRSLTSTEVRNLGLFRQAYQLLRQGIRDDKSMEYGYRDPQYRLFNELGCKVAHTLAGSASHHRPTLDQACDAFENILGYRTEHFEDAVDQTKLRPYKRVPRVRPAQIGADPGDSPDAVNPSAVA